MDLIVQFIMSFLATACFGVIFNTPRNLIFHSGFVGAIGWMIYYAFTERGIDVVEASFFGAFVVAIVAHIYARRYKMPVLLFSVAGIIPLVPGGMAYNTMRNVVEDDYLQGLQYGMKAFLITGAIVMGLVFAEVLMQLIFRLLQTSKTKISIIRKK